jgi:hypothetical protein
MQCNNFFVGNVGQITATIKTEIKSGLINQVISSWEVKLAVNNTNSM